MDEEEGEGGGSITALMVEMKYLRSDVKDLKKDLKTINDRSCPQPICHNHEVRLSTLETYFKVMVGAFILVIIPLSIALIGAMWGT